MVLKPQDIFITLKLVALGNESWSYVRLANELFMSASEINAGVKRSLRAGLLIGGHQQTEYKKKLMNSMNMVGSHSHWPNRQAIHEFLVHGAKYSFPPDLGEVTRGIPTATAAAPIKKNFMMVDELPPVWPYLEGEVKGYSFSPIYRSAPQAALHDPNLYELLVILDTLRGGKAREREKAAQELDLRLSKYGSD
ncbi:hypothetical protein BMS3Abin14_00586 [bacterium BMS3Abin14]|nr:hypothetical protein BMS3Abin14_00586 [bacterium BMS3Abin14]